LEEPKDCPKPSAKLEISSQSASWAGENGKPVGQFEACLTAPADTPVTITLHNEKMKGVAFQEECNLSVYADPEATDEIVKGKIIPAGKTTTVEVPPLSTGLYLFKCDLHPNSMKGVLVVE
jgi:hypothetical protein